MLSTYSALEVRFQFHTNKTDHCSLVIFKSDTIQFRFVLSLVQRGLLRFALFGSEKGVNVLLWQLVLLKYDLCFCSETAKVTKNRTGASVWKQFSSLCTVVLRHGGKVRCFSQAVSGRLAAARTLHRGGGSASAVSWSCWGQPLGRHLSPRRGLWTPIWNALGAAVLLL